VIAAVQTERLFFALQPDEPTRARCAEAAHLGRVGPGREVAPENIHLTLVFLGATSPERRACAERVATAYSGSQFVLTLDTLGHFPRPQVVWIGATTVPAELVRLVQFLSSGLADCGFSVETRPYVPHVTLVRKARHAPSVRSIEPIAWHCGSFVLMKSDTSQGIPRYEVLHAWPLASLAD
jgi:2'-5' RNA ligase